MFSASSTKFRFVLITILKNRIERLFCISNKTASFTVPEMDFFLIGWCYSRLSYPYISNMVYGRFTKNKGI